MNVYKKIGYCQPLCYTVKNRLLFDFTLLLYKEGFKLLFLGGWSFYFYFLVVTI
jgi:hypothetical protein